MARGTTAPKQASKDDTAGSAHNGAGNDGAGASPDRAQPAQGGRASPSAGERPPVGMALETAGDDDATTKNPDGAGNDNGGWRDEGKGVMADDAVRAGAFGATDAASVAPVQPPALAGGGQPSDAGAGARCGGVSG